MLRLVFSLLGCLMLIPSGSAESDRFPGSPKAVVVMVHGLNTQPQVMQPWADWLTSYGVQVQLVQLSGHRSVTDSLATVTALQWKKDLFQVYRCARAQAEQAACPLYFVGFSLGAVVNAALMTDCSLPNGAQPTYDKLILLAPALKLRPLAYGVQVFHFLGPHFELPSWNRPEFRVHSGTCLAAYWALFELVEAVQNASPKLLNRPTLLIGADDDELVDMTEISRYQQQRGLDQWQVMTLPSQATLQNHHNMVSVSNLTPTAWRAIQNRIVQFLGLE